MAAASSPEVDNRYLDWAVVPAPTPATQVYEVHSTPIPPPNAYSAPPPVAARPSRPPPSPSPTLSSESSSPSSSSSSSPSPLSLSDPDQGPSFAPDTAGPVFKMALRAVMVDQGKGYVPFVVEKCMRFLKDHLNEEGLFRVSGDVGNVDRMIKAFDSGENVILSKFTRNPHDVASLLKQFFHQLPEPLIPYELFDPFLASQTPSVDLEAMRRVCDQIPEYNAALLECLLKFLREIIKHASVNKMTVENLGMVFGPCLMRKPGAAFDPLGALTDIKLMNSVVSNLIQNVEPLFGIHRLSGSLNSVYDVGRELGSGAFATVYLVHHKVTRQPFAAKVIKKTSLNSEDRVRLDAEVDILRRIRHPAVIALKAVCETPSELILVMELAEGGELFDKLVQDGKYTEMDAVRILQQLLSALEYLHAQHIVHRDLKPENILLKFKDKKEIKIADFGLGKIYNEMANLKSICGSPGFVAPEILEETIYGPEVDMWSTGVIAYILLSGVPPFYANNMRALFDQIKKGSYSFPSPYWDGVSAQAKDFVRNLLVLDPKARMTAVTAQQHPFMVGRSETLDTLKMAALLQRTHQLNRVQSKIALESLVTGPQSSKPPGVAPKPKPKPSAPSGPSSSTTSPAPVSIMSDSSKGKAHKWVKCHYNSPTWCNYCQKFLWGLRFQGVQCVNCKLDLHKKCSGKLGDTCSG